MTRTTLKAVITLSLLLVWQMAIARDYVLSVGSSTVFPFATTIAERIGKTTRFKTPQVEALGSGGGFKLFCQGIGVDHPDIALASREIKATELKQCIANKVGELEEIKFGYDGIVFASNKEAPHMSLTPKYVYLALAKRVPDPAGAKRLIPNPYQRWSGVNPRLPDLPIKVYGPPITSGTRDVLLERALEPGCRSIVWMNGMRRTDPEQYEQTCQTIREDGPYVNSGENDNLLVRKLIQSKDAVAIFGFSFFDQNRDNLQAADCNGVQPSFDTLYEQIYPLSRPLYTYVKHAHIGWIPGLRAFLRELVSDGATGEDGYLVERGLVPLPEAERRANLEKVLALKPSM